MLQQNLLIAGDMLNQTFGTSAPDQDHPLDSRTLNMSLSEFVMQNPHASVRLRNGICAAAHEGTLPFDSVFAYLAAGAQSAERMLKLPNLGQKSIAELSQLIREWSEQLPFQASSPPETGPIPADFDISLQEFLQKQFKVSARLNNAIVMATQQGICPFNTVTQYIEADEQGYAQLRQLPNLGTNSANEFEELVRVALNAGTTDPLLAQRTAQENGFPDLEQVMEGVFISLEPKELDVLLDRVQSKKTLQTVADSLGVTREAVRQIQAKALKRLSQGYGRVLQDAAWTIRRRLTDVGIKECTLTDFARLTSCDIITSEFFLGLVQKLELTESALLVHVDHHIILPMAFMPQAEWDDAIKQALLSSTWPLNLNTLLQDLESIPQFYVLDRLCQDYQANIIDKQFTAPPKLSTSDMCLCALKTVDGPLHVKQIRANVFRFFGQDLSDQNINATVGRHALVAIAGPGTYIHYANLRYTSHEIDQIRDTVFAELSKKNTFLSSKVLFDRLFATAQHTPNGLNHYLMLGIVQDDPRFISKRGNMIGLTSFFDLNEAFISLEDEVRNLVLEHGPISIMDIQLRLSETRKLCNDSGIRLILSQSPDVIKVGPRTYDAFDRFFESRAAYDDFVLAVKVSLCVGPKSLYALTEDLLRLGFTGINSYILESLLDAIHDIIKGPHGYKLEGRTPELECYQSIAETCFARGDGQAHLLYFLQGTAAAGNAEKLVRYDSRFISGRDAMTNTTDYSEIHSILNEFDF